MTVSLAFEGQMCVSQAEIFCVCVSLFLMTPQVMLLTY